MSLPSDDVIKFLRGLRAVREYTSDPIPDTVVHDILEVGRWAGSGHNSQPVEIVIVRDQATKQLLAENGVRAAAGAALALVLVTPADSARKELDMFDEGRLVERLLLAARAHGLGTNVATLKGQGPAIVQQALSIPADHRALVVVTVGHTDHAARRARIERMKAPPQPGTEYAPWETAGRKPMTEFARCDKY